MQFVLRVWKKFLYLLITGSTSVFIAACYGMPAGFSDLGEWQIRTCDENNTPVAGLEVTVLQYVGDAQVPDTMDQQLTDSLGYASFRVTTFHKDASSQYDAAIRDIDGTGHGGTFRDTTVHWSGETETTITVKHQ